MPTDLFPETLLVSINNGIPMTDSKKVAEHFHKRHDNVLRAIRTYLECAKDPRGLLNFEASSFLNEQNKQQLMYLLTKDGFAFIVGKFHGEIAEAWQWDFIDAFNALEAEFAARVEREANALYHLRPHWREIGEGTAAGLRRVQICATTGHKSPQTITANRRRMRIAGLLAA